MRFRHTERWPIDPNTSVAPHEWAPLGRWFRRRRICRACYLPESDHPVGGWSPARPVGDEREPIAPGKLRALAAGEGTGEGVE